MRIQRLTGLFVALLLSFGILGQPALAGAIPPEQIDYSYATNTADDFANHGSEFLDDAIRAPVVRPDLGNLSTKIQGNMTSRGWTPGLVDEAVLNGRPYLEVNKLGGANTPATRYVHPTTGQSVVIDNATGQVIHVGGPGFGY
ncbi:MAG: hypothetical protein GY788_26605 [bacterium]|nr:hypothetical protein [bacterium]